MKRSNIPDFRAFYTVVSKRNLQKSPWSWIPLLWEPTLLVLADSKPAIQTPMDTTRFWQSRAFAPGGSCEAVFRTLLGFLVWPRFSVKMRLRSLSWRCWHGEGLLRSFQTARFTQESPRQTKPKKGPKRKVHEFRPFLWILVFFLGKTSAIRIELWCRFAPKKSSWTGLSLVWLPGWLLICSKLYFFQKSIKTWKIATRLSTCSFCHLYFVKEFPRFGRKISAKIG